MEIELVSQYLCGNKINYCFTTPQTIQDNSGDN